jgi:tetratricopeptide (TPR) repeat protein
MLNSYQTTRLFLVSALSAFVLTTNSPIATASVRTRNHQQTSQAVDANALVQAAYQAYENGKFDEAVANCTKALKLNPDDFRAHGIAGLAYAAQWKMKSSSAAFAEAIKLRPDIKDFHVLKAKADISLGEVDQAIAGCRKALELDPKYAEAYATIGEALEHNEKRRSEAISAYQSALELDPKLFRAYEALGQLFLSLKDEKKAEEIFRQGMAADPKSMTGRFALGRLYVQQGKLVEARQLWNERTSDEDRLGPKFIDLLTRAENMKRATAQLAEKPNDANALNDMGLAVMDGESWIVDGRQQRAIVYFKKALQIRPDFAQAQYNLVKAMIQCLDDKGKDKKTVDQELAKLRKLDPKLAAEMEQYRKTYDGGGLIGTPVNVKQ